LSAENQIFYLFEVGITSACAKSPHLQFQAEIYVTDVNIAPRIQIKK
jgi:hypothetical protein